VHGVVPAGTRAASSAACDARAQAWPARCGRGLSRQGAARDRASKKGSTQMQHGCTQVHADATWAAKSARLLRSGWAVACRERPCRTEAHQRAFAGIRAASALSLSCFGRMPHGPAKLRHGVARHLVMARRLTVHGVLPPPQSSACHAVWPANRCMGFCRDSMLRRSALTLLGVGPTLDGMDTWMTRRDAVVQVYGVFAVPARFCPPGLGHGVERSRLGWS
jgi:hypothetical protein